MSKLDELTKEIDEKEMTLKIPTAELLLLKHERRELREKIKREKLLESNNAYICVKCGEFVENLSDMVGTVRTNHKMCYNCWSEHTKQNVINNLKEKLIDGIIIDIDINGDRDLDLLTVKVKGKTYELYAQNDYDNIHIEIDDITEEVKKNA